ncbi:zinc-dependent metalloprotease [Acanthopleuribacter pedis]|uniref:Zinc-dependent metalloprotease n=1 Tax=Acanthopleuribacter pedis TaxID=442870 RepID=A0A8J7QDX7_9BACT|nr:zinc-dependent metalloprotease [Acanthopleuribacter pedis]MBO1319226.1 zinc-dependent metalloprotease [Acanthopleuribacter pedis]
MTLVLLSMLLLFEAPDQAPDFLEDKQVIPGYMDLAWDEQEGELYLAVDNLEQHFILAAGIAGGLGSNDVGLDRGLVDNTRLVYFKRVGPRLFLMQPNTYHTAFSENPAEQRAVAESFAASVLWSVEIEEELDGTLWIPLNEYIFADRAGIADRLAEAEQGDFGVEEDASFVYLPRTKAFPRNTEIEVMLTLEGDEPGDFVRDVTPDATRVSVRQHFSIVQLPEPGYKPRVFHPRSGGFPFTLRDYAAPLDAPLEKHWVYRHRLVRKDPGAKRSELVEPLVYYLDPGTPPQIRDALIEGASWWNEAFEAAGIIDGFQVKMLPADADPMDVRYNVIQWVHRATRGWSYGWVIPDPRTGEIIKGFVILGSQRVRQDRLLFEGMLPLQKNGSRGKWDPVELALARIRQLSAHEVGHTLGIAHNFAASAHDRASVMDYPAPLVTLKRGKLDFSEVYDVGIGVWDKQAVKYLYGEWRDEAKGLAAVLKETEKKGLPFITDEHSREVSDAHPTANLWDNGADPIDEFERMVALRNHVLQNFSTANLSAGRTYSELEEVLVPVYLMHRYQLEALAKSIGGIHFDYRVKDRMDEGTLTGNKPVSADRQRRAVTLLLQTMEPQFLSLPGELAGAIPPRAYGYPMHRELFARRTGAAPDHVAMAETSLAMSLTALLEPSRLHRIANQHALDGEQLGVAEVLDELVKKLVVSQSERGAKTLMLQAREQAVRAMLERYGDGEIRGDIRTLLAGAVQNTVAKLTALTDAEERNHGLYLQQVAEKLLSEEDYHEAGEPVEIPPGSPIGN